MKLRIRCCILLMNNAILCLAFQTFSHRSSLHRDSKLGLHKKIAQFSDQSEPIKSIRTDETSKTCSESEETVSYNRARIRGSSRRAALQTIAAAAAVFPMAARAGIAELDESTGVLYSPKSEMFSGGSLAARGIPVSSKPVGSIPRMGQQGPFQTVYETRFIAYLARFLLNFDPSANAWWIKQGFGDSWDNFGSGNSFATDKDRKLAIESKFAEFAESVEIGLADYFTGPYGSYSSPSAAKAGLLATYTAPSVDAAERRAPPRPLIDSIFGLQQPPEQLVNDKKATKETFDNARAGILNLYALLKARYTSVAAKRQLAILFSFVSSPRLQPTNEIRALLGECDNACVSKIEFIPSRSKSTNEIFSRTSSRRGGGYSLGEPPQVSISTPPALGADYVPAEAKPIMRPTSRILCIDVLDGGEGYSAAPSVRVVGTSVRPAQVVAILDRNKRVESILVLDPGYGYGGSSGVPPRIVIDAPERGKKTRRARGVASLEYEIVGLDVVRGGNGYTKAEPPAITISPPEIDPDWFLPIQRDPKLRMRVPEPPDHVQAEVAEMRFPDGTLAYSNEGMPRNPLVDDEMIERVQRSPLEMLPTSVRPERYKFGTYAIPSLVAVPQFVAVLSPRYRACDPVFGGVGRVPVTKGAVQLKASEYARLALSGAVCTVLVRTLLNPLELIKTKQQLLNDEELIKFASSKLLKSTPPPPAAGLVLEGPPMSDTSPIRRKDDVGLDMTAKSTQLAIDQSQQIGLTNESGSTPDAKPLGTIDMVRSMVELRGFPSLFQSADITFLASLVFGSFGFGATELFRRSFTAFFITGSGVDEGGLDVVAVLAAASLATVITAAAAAPFEVLRVRSMGLVEQTGWTLVLRDFIAQKSGKPIEDFSLSKLRPKDILPLWAGFAPTVSRELPFAVIKFLTFDLIAKAMVTYLNSQAGEGSLPIQVGAGPVGLTVSAIAGAIAGIAGAIISHPADLILTKTSASPKDGSPSQDWKDVVKELLERDGGVANLFVGLPARSTFFFLVIGLQFFLYDYVKNVLNVGQDDLSLVLDVFYAVRAGLAGNTS